MSGAQDFCLSCDNVNPTEAAYCSEACRLLDLDRSTESYAHADCDSHPYAPTTTNYTWSSASGANRSSGIFLPPAINFYALRSSTNSAGTVSLPNSPSAASSADAFFAAAASQHSRSSTHSRRHHSISKGSLTTSSSRSSLSSITTNGSSSHGVSDLAMSQLRNYVNSFDQSREQRRRVTLA